MKIFKKKESGEDVVLDLIKQYGEIDDDAPGREKLEQLVSNNENLRILAKKLYTEKQQLEKNAVKNKKWGLLLILAGTLMLLLFAWGEYKNYMSAQRLKALQEQKSNGASYTGDMDTSEILPEYKDMYVTNSDLVGWIVIEGTDINYPVVQSTVYQEFYLDHDFDGEKDEAGSIFVDARNDIWAPDDNIILYGHNMKDGSMFGSLQSYLKESFYEKHKTISFDTLFERQTYEIVAVGLSKVTEESSDNFRYYDFLNADSKREFREYAANIERLQVYDTGVEMKYGDSLITLSTCNSVEHDGRLFVVAREIDKSE